MKRDQKKAAIKKFQTHGKDTGSSQVQVAILTEKINSLSDHLKKHPKDTHSRRGLLGMVGARRRQLKHLQLNDAPQYTKVTKDLGIRK